MSYEHFSERITTSKFYVSCKPTVSNLRNKVFKSILKPYLIGKLGKSILRHNDLDLD
jgi:hypothetical protein